MNKKVDLIPGRQKFLKLIQRKTKKACQKGMMEKANIH